MRGTLLRTAHYRKRRYTRLAAGRPGGLGGGLGLPGGGLAEARRLEDLESEERALDARGGDVDPQQVEHEGAVEAQDVIDLHPDDLLGRHRRGGLGDRAAVAGEADLGDRARFVGVHLHAQLVPAERIRVEELEVRGIQLAPVRRVLVVLEDVLSVEVVHQANTSCTVPRPSIRRSTSARELWIAYEARVEAGEPSRRCSGCAQWWPARTHTPERPRISATSCGWMPSSANEVSDPRCSRSDGPYSVSPSISDSRSTAYSVTSRPCARTSSMPIPDSQSIAAPSPIASATGIVPASNLAGGSAQVDSVSPTRAIMCPPPRNGGISSSTPRRPWST